MKVEEFDCRQPLLVGKAVHDISKGDQKVQRRLHESDLVVQLLVSLPQLFIDIKLLSLYSQLPLQTSFLTTLSFYTGYYFTERIVFSNFFCSNFKGRM